MEDKITGWRVESDGRASRLLEGMAGSPLVSTKKAGLRLPGRHAALELW